MVNQDVQIGDILTLKWGEPGTTAKTLAEPHRQVDIRMRLSAPPFAAQARTNYAENWRIKNAVI